MDKAAVQEYIIDFQKRKVPLLIPRELVLDTTKKIRSIIGPRRAGKTHFLYQQMVQLGVSREQILYLNFEDPRLIDVTFKEIKEIVKLHWQLYPTSAKKTVFLFIDEPQNIDRWEIAVRSLYEEGFPVFLTGSSAKLLSREIATSLRGRTLSYMLLPFSFREFLLARKFHYTSHLSSEEKALLQAHSDQYLSFGGFPEIILEENPDIKLKILQEYFNLVVYRDIVERYAIKNTQLVKWLLRLLSTAFAKEFSIHKTYLTLQSQGLHLSKNTLYSYVSMLEDCLFVFLLQKWSTSPRKRDLSIQKVYLCDIGFSKLTETSSNLGQKMENIVFLELLRRKTPLTSLSYWKNEQQEEVDFIIEEKGKAKELLQVCTSLQDIDTRKRELRAILKAAREVSCSKLSIITKEEEGIITTKGEKIMLIPLWKWLLTYAR